VIDSNLVDPFYMHFMNANILTTTPLEERAAVRELFRRRLPDYDDPTLKAMLNGGWRASKVGAWAIAAGDRVALLPDVASHLQSGAGYVEHCCIALACLGRAESVPPLTSYLERCADGSMQRNAVDDTVGPHWALAALQSLEAATAVPDADQREARWQQFLDRQDTRLREAFVRGRDEATTLLPRAVDWLRGMR
jgi:hypothetical protein